MPRRCLILVAGGQSRRLGSGQPKQFRELGGRPVLEWPLTAFAEAGVEHVAVVLPETHRTEWAERLRRRFPSLSVQTAPAGNERFFSVRNGLQAIAQWARPDDLVAVHDAARPFVRPALLRRGWETALRRGGAVPYVPLADSVRIRQLNQWAPFPREAVRAVQTPQIFRFDGLQQAYALPYRPEFTDEASVADAALLPWDFYEGDPLNFKITRPTDWVLAQAVATHWERLIIDHAPDAPPSDMSSSAM